MRPYSSHCQFEIEISSLRINDYDPIAPVFDAAFGNDFADVAFEPICHQINQHFAQDVKIKHLDLCCGTGTFLCRLAKTRQTQSFGIDLSTALIGIAQRKARRGEQDVQFLCGDVLRQAFPARCDLVTMNLDALNHIRSTKEWSDLFRKVCRILKPSGVFMFDVNSPRRLLSDWDFPEVLLKPHLTYVQCALPAETHNQIVRRRILMQIFDHSRASCVARSALIEQISVPQQKVASLLRNAGFSRIKRWHLPANHELRNVFLKNRWFYIAQR